MMGFGYSGVGLGSLLMPLMGIVWLIVGILLIVWLWKQISK